LGSLTKGTFLTATLPVLLKEDLISKVSHSVTYAREATISLTSLRLNDPEGAKLRQFAG
jgi:hypothetical protein